MRIWLARLAFSFFIVGTFLGYNAWQDTQGLHGPVSQMRIALKMVAVAACVVLGILGIRERHRPDRS